ncbi:MAG: hypothetical protein CML06_19260 [Pseudomonadales bacterium]|nr:hypothetical protein [Pseudomonadales bacterium]MAR92992.1 hypothetical protein [Pseudomonadales bacterium]
MSTETIVLLSVAGLAALVALFYISHTIEKQRRQNALLIANLSDFTYRLQRLLDVIPPAYLGRDIQLLLLNQIKKRMQRLQELAPGNEKFRKKLDAASAQIEDIKAGGGQTGKPQLKNPEEANQIRALLQELGKVIENFARNKVLSPDSARKHLQFIQASFVDANLNYLLQLGQTAHQEGKPKLALLNYEKALAEMKKHNGSGAYSARMEQVMAQMEVLKADQGQAPAREPDADNELTQAMTELLEEEDAWKKKYF